MKPCRLAFTRLCVERDFTQGWLFKYAQELKLQVRVHRKVWEFAAIARMVSELELLKPGRNGLGFGVGTEPLTSYFAGHDVQVVATDLATDDTRTTAWAPSAQHAGSLGALYHKDLCAEKQFTANVRFRPLDMTQLPEDLGGGFDFLWSCSSLEHLGSIRKGLCFMRESLKYLRPGGVAIHTTEFNATSDTFTLDNGEVVVFRRSDLEPFLNSLACELRATWDIGSGKADMDIDVAPYRAAPHLKLRLGGVVLMSALIVLVKED